MKRTSVVALTLMALLSLALTVWAKDGTEKLTGVLVDKSCSAKVAKSETPQTAAEGHPKGCAVKCKDGGYGVFVDGKFYEFDAKGNELALKVLEGSSADKGVKVNVEGTKHENHLMVSKLEEVK